jgi:bacteriocin-like protein
MKPLSFNELESISGGGGWSCFGAVIQGGLLAYIPYIGPFLGAMRITCGCDDELDNLFGTNFTEACC